MLHSSSPWPSASSAGSLATSSLRMVPAVQDHFSSDSSAPATVLGRKAVGVDSEDGQQSIRVKQCALFIQSNEGTLSDFVALRQPELQLVPA